MSCGLPAPAPAERFTVRTVTTEDVPVCYPETRAWSQAAYLQCSQARAVGYGSRRDDSGRCLVLFRQRLPDSPFAVLDEHCLANPPFRNEVLALVRSLGIREI